VPTERQAGIASTKEGQPLSDTEIISIVDDDASARSAAARLVQALGWQARTFSSGEEFLQSSHLSETCCLITDVQMPRLNGLDLQSRLNGESRRIPVIFMTAFSETSVQAKAMAAGAVCYLTKPLDATTLEQCIKLALDQRSQQKLEGK
jgi:FixJ family two-component response regulator